MVVAAAAVAALDLDQIGIATVGGTPPGLPPGSIPDFSGIDLGTLLPAALGVTVVAPATAVIRQVRKLDRTTPTTVGHRYLPLTADQRIKGSKDQRIKGSKDQAYRSQVEQDGQ